jgi:DNA-binding NarL/FixJ family response regulator
MEILIVEDSVSVWGKVGQLLEGEHGCNRITCVASTEQALCYLAFNWVDLILLDLDLPYPPGSAAVKALKTVCPEVEIVVVSSSDHDRNVFSALRAGAVGYLLKSDLSKQISAAIEEILAGGAPMSPSIATKVLQSYQRQPERAEGLVGDNLLLSGREAEILELLYHGDELPQIAEHLCISLHTVRVHTKRIYTKLQVNSRSHATFRALQMNLIKP